jgi:hypothetical protein
VAAQKHRNIIANGDFSQGQDGAMPPGWKQETEVVVTDAHDRFGRDQPISALSSDRSVEARQFDTGERDSRAGECEERGSRAAYAREGPRARDGLEHLSGLDPERARWPRRGRGEATVEAKADTNWKRFTGRLDLPATAKTLKVTVGPHGAAGIFDFERCIASGNPFR